jgi:cytochrome P450
MQWETAFAQDPIASLRTLAAEQGALAEFAVAGQRCYLLSQPEWIQQALVHRQLPKRQGRGAATCLLGRGLMTSEGALNRSQRRGLRPLFSRAAQAPWADIVDQETEALCQSWRPGQVLNTLAEFSRLSLAVACRCLLGQRLPEEPMILKSLEESLQCAHSPAPLRAIRRDLDGVAQRLLQAGRGPLVERLLALPIDDELRRDEIVTMVLGAHETTAVTMAWCMRLLALHPHEVGGATRPVVAEALRLYPPGWIIARQVEQRLCLGPFQLEAPATLLMSPMVTHYLPEFWPEPERFLPRRFLHDKPIPGSYFPFGGGERICIGESLAWLEASRAISLLSRQWRLVPLDSSAVRLRPLAALRPACGLPARAEHLSDRACGAPPGGLDAVRPPEERARSCD